MGASGLAVHPHGVGQHPRQTPEAGLLSERFGAAAARGSGRHLGGATIKNDPATQALRRGASCCLCRPGLGEGPRRPGRPAGTPWTAWTLLSMAAGSAGQFHHARAMTGPPDRKDIGRTPQRPGRRDRDDRTSRSRPGQGPRTGAGMGWACWQRPGNCRRPVDGDGGESPSQGGGPCRDNQAQGTHQQGTFTSLSSAGVRAGSVQVRDASTGICPGQAGLDPAGSAR
jgi:hypothetical protein